MSIVPLRLHRPAKPLNHSAYPCPGCHTAPLTPHTGICVARRPLTRRRTWGIALAIGLAIDLATAVLLIRSC